MLAIFCENKQRFFKCANKVELKPDGVRRIRASSYRYCLGANFFYIPAEQDGLEEGDRVCWVRDRELYSLEALNKAYASGDIHFSDVRIGNTYTKRNQESDGKFVEVERFIGQELYEQLQKNPEALPNVSKGDFEGLCAELFVRRGFEVDLFRETKDGGIDFLAVKNEDIDPLIVAVQCKQPDQRDGKPRKALGRPVVQQIYGAAKAWDLHGAVAISGSTYSREAADFAKNKPEEIRLHDAHDVLDWIQKYRWNKGE
ncbi:restriction endonuclease [Mesorhizobium sp. M0902]|uniref:restriction endonuclease n=1 Tax=unclassified Mesorhizobium TaxID=325217 RepID=UPI0033371611